MTHIICSLLEAKKPKWQD